MARLAAGLKPPRQQSLENVRRALLRAGVISIDIQGLPAWTDVHLQISLALGEAGAQRWPADLPDGRTSGGTASSWPGCLIGLKCRVAALGLGGLGVARAWAMPGRAALEPLQAPAWALSQQACSPGQTANALACRLASTHQAIARSSAFDLQAATDWTENKANPLRRLRGNTAPCWKSQKISG